MQNAQNLENKKILITGGSGFIGTHLIQVLTHQGITDVTVPHSKTCDLRKKDNCKKVVQGVDIVIHLAARVGGIGYNLEHPAEMFYDNISIGIHLMHESWLAGVKKFVAIGTICCYPKVSQVPFREEDLWNGYPEETNAPYGLAKKMLLVQSQAYRRQYGFHSIFILPVNIYGIGDNFNPTSSHVIPALIRKMFEAKRKGMKEVVLWGTGNATREFLWVDDAVEGIILATKFYDKPEPVNLGTGSEISIRDLASMIKRLIGYQGKIVWDTTKPDGQPRRVINTQRAQREFGFRAVTKLEDGLLKVIRWYERTKMH